MKRQARRLLLGARAVGRGCSSGEKRKGRVIILEREEQMPRVALYLKVFRQCQCLFIFVVMNKSSSS